MLSPSTRQTRSSPTNSRPISRASAMPRATGCSAKVIFSPYWAPSPSRARKVPVSPGGTITMMSEIPACIRMAMG